MKELEFWTKVIDSEYYRKMIKDHYVDLQKRVNDAVDSGNLQESMKLRALMKDALTIDGIIKDKIKKLKVEEE